MGGRKRKENSEKNKRRRGNFEQENKTRSSMKIFSEAIKKYATRKHKEYWINEDHT